jgi:hypothetical protein
MPFVTRAALAACSLAAASAVAAQPPGSTVVAAVNDEFAPAVNTRWAVASVGWFYTPATAFTLTGVFTRFAAGGAARPVTLEVLTAPRADGGALLRGAAFAAPATAPGADPPFVGATFAALQLQAGQRYFFGFRGVGAAGSLGDVAGINVTDAAGAARLVYRSDRDGSGSYADALTSPEPIEARPILRFVGTAPAAVVPEPSAAALLAAGGAARAAGARRRRAGR